MGDPRKQRKKYETPRFPWRTDIMQEELKLIGQYGLRNKHELWRQETMLSTFRGTARSLIGKTPDERRKMEEELLARLKRLGILSETAVLDDVLDMTIEDILERRLQTIVLRKGLAKTIQQSRQLITHGHVAIGGKRVKIPSHTVTKNEEDQIEYLTQSSLANPSHPLRQTITTAPESQAGSEKVRGEEEDF
jgi:small subunit ribosomal protein S4